MDARYRLSSQDVMRILGDHLAEVTAPMGDVDMDVRLYDADGNQIAVPSLVAEIVQPPDAGSVTVLVMEPVDETDEYEEEDEGEPEGSHAESNGAHV